ncbi:hypothetical protein DES34_102297 [Brevibacillus brevis]|nr:hypothetical protein DES34_102297 [Brevibacillus brevis]GEC92120.1 hypothetical protein BBR01nite_44510 [Brevibacillus brevis]VEF92300.1 Uncharacterised protein [Brevibacillus brevis]
MKALILAFLLTIGLIGGIPFEPIHDGLIKAKAYQHGSDG